MAVEIVPIFKCSNLKKAVAFYTEVLDFTYKFANDSFEDGVIDLQKGGACLQLTIYESPALFGSVVNLRVDDVDGLFKTYLNRGLDTSAKKNSPVHTGPVDQSWGRREFYVTDADGNTLRFFKPIN